MKSAYELAMERLQQSAPSTALSDAQKALLAEVDREITAKIAERKLLLESEMAKADPVEVEALRQQLTMELARLEEKRERDKDKIRAGK